MAWTVGYLRHLLAPFVLCFLSCGSVLMNQPVERKAKDWTIVLTKVTDGPDSYAQGDQSRYVPPDDHRFLWFTVTIRNAAPTPRTFNYQRCDVDEGGDRILPALVDKDSVINALADEEEEIGSGQQISRKLAFPYPEDRLPTKLSCGEIVIELPLKTARANHGDTRDERSCGGHVAAADPAVSLSVLRSPWDKAAPSGT
jgi:hypothetical protein